MDFEQGNSTFLLFALELVCILWPPSLPFALLTYLVMKSEPINIYCPENLVVGPFALCFWN